jgi:hypothetical protein
MAAEIDYPLTQQDVEADLLNLFDPERKYPDIGNAVRELTDLPSGDTTDPNLINVIIDLGRAIKRSRNLSEFRRN